MNHYSAHRRDRLNTGSEQRHVDELAELILDDYASDDAKFLAALTRTELDVAGQPEVVKALRDCWRLHYTGQAATPNEVAIGGWVDNILTASAEDEAIRRIEDENDEAAQEAADERRMP